MDNPSSNRRRQSEDQTKAQAEKQPRRESQYHDMGRSRVQLFRLIVRSICDAERDR
jgi:hypothetical protein